MTEFEGRKHGGSLYRRGCRCEVCVEAMVQYRRQYNKQTDRPSKLRLPIAPLVNWIVSTGSVEMMHPRVWWRWQSNPEMTIDVYWADRYAIQLGSHPAEIWGLDFYSDIDVAVPL